MNTESITKMLNNLPADTAAPKVQRPPMRINPTVQTAVTFVVGWTLFVAGFTYQGAMDKQKAAAATTTPATALAAAQGATTVTTPGK